MIANNIIYVVCLKLVKFNNLKGFLWEITWARMSVRITVFW